MYNTWKKTLKNPGLGTLTKSPKNKKTGLVSHSFQREHYSQSNWKKKSCLKWYRRVELQIYITAKAHKNPTKSVLCNNAVMTTVRCVLVSEDNISQFTHASKILLHISTLWPAQYHIELGTTKNSVEPPLVRSWTRLPFSGLSGLLDHLYKSLKHQSTHRKLQQKLHNTREMKIPRFSIFFLRCNQWIEWETRI